MNNTKLENITTITYVIIGEYQGIQDSCEAFATEDEQHKAFERLTGFTWQQYIDGDYSFDAAVERNGTFYRCFEVEQPVKESGNKVTLQVNIECYNRTMNVIVDRPKADQAAAIMDKRYDIWVEGTQADTIDTCCEEYILEGLTEANIQFERSFIENQEGS